MTTNRKKLLSFIAKELFIGMLDFIQEDNYQVSILLLHDNTRMQYTL